MLLGILDFKPLPTQSKAYDLSNGIEHGFFLLRETENGSEWPTNTIFACENHIRPDSRQWASQLPYFTTG